MKLTKSVELQFMKLKLINIYNSTYVTQNEHLK